MFSIYDDDKADMLFEKNKSDEKAEKEAEKKAEEAQNELKNYLRLPKNHTTYQLFVLYNHAQYYFQSAGDDDAYKAEEEFNKAEEEFNNSLSSHQDEKVVELYDKLKKAEKALKKAENDSYKTQENYSKYIYSREYYDKRENFLKEQNLK